MTSRLPRRFSKSQRPDLSPLDLNNGTDRNFEKDHGLHSTSRLELWLLDLMSGQKVELAPPDEWLRSKLYKSSYSEVSHKLTKLKQPWRTAIIDFLQFRNEIEVSKLVWRLCFVGLPRRVSRMAIFGHHHGDCLVQLVICQQNNANGAVDPALGPARSSPHPQGISSSALLHPEPLPKSQTRPLLQGGKSVFKDSNDTGARSDGQRSGTDFREVAFADDTESHTKDDSVRTIQVESEVIDGETSRSTTLIPSDVISTSALDELGLPWVELPGGPNDDPPSVLKVPMDLRSFELDRLMFRTKLQIVNGEGKPGKLWNP